MRCSGRGSVAVDAAVSEVLLMRGCSFVCLFVITQRSRLRLVPRLQRTRRNQRQKMLRPRSQVSCCSQSTVHPCRLRAIHIQRQLADFIMAALRSTCGHIFVLWFLLLSSFFLSSPNLSRRRFDVYHTSTHGVALVRI